MGTASPELYQRHENPRPQLSHATRPDGGEVFTQLLFRLFDAANEFRLNPAPVRFLCMLIVLFLCHFYMVLVN